ncbi:MAG: HPr family phosphocarrier protein [Rhodoluna sp.]|nr:HPr family phosphocarrier protein [Rhodoluna sp.]
MVKGSVVVGTEVGLHARPAADFVRLASLSGHQVNITNRVGKKAVGTSILGVLSLGAKYGEELLIEVDGPDEAKVLEALIAVVSGQKSV